MSYIPVAMQNQTEPTDFQTSRLDTNNPIMLFRSNALGELAIFCCCDPQNQQLMLIGTVSHVVLNSAKYVLCHEYILDISSTSTPLCSPSVPASSEANSISQVPLIWRLAHMNVIYFPDDAHCWQCGPADE